MPTGVATGEVTCKTAVVLARGASVKYEGLTGAVQPEGVAGGTTVIKKDDELHAVVS